MVNIYSRFYLPVITGFTIFTIYHCISISNFAREFDWKRRCCAPTNQESTKRRYVAGLHSTVENCGVDMYLSVPTASP